MRVYIILNRGDHRDIINVLLINVLLSVYINIQRRAQDWGGGMRRVRRLEVISSPRWLKNTTCMWFIFLVI